MLSGSLEVFSLHDVLRLICGAGASGRIRVRRGDSHGSLTVAAGRVTGAEVGGADAPDAEATIDAAMEILHGNGGEFDLVHEEAAGPLDLDLDGFLERVREREAEWNEVIQSLGSPDTIFRIAPDPASEKVTLTGAQWRLLALVDGHRTAREIVREAGGVPFAVYSGLSELARAGFVVPEGGEVQVVSRKDGGVADEDSGDFDPAALLRELGGAQPVEEKKAKVRILTREEQRMRLRK